jgi:uncharacterized membrane protein YhaH (DUF805 family)
MKPLSLMFGFRGFLGQVGFIVGLAIAVVVFIAGVNGSLMALPWMGEVLGPRGINAGLVLNGIWLALGVLLTWSVTALAVKRLRDRGRSPWWAVAAVLPLAALALASDTIFLVSRSFIVPELLRWAVLTICGTIGLWLLVEGALLPGRPRA